MPQRGLLHASRCGLRGPGRVGPEAGGGVVRVGGGEDRVPASGAAVAVGGEGRVAGGGGLAV